MITMLRLAVVSVAALAVTAFVLWLKKESPHPTAAIAVRESPFVQARSLKSPLQTVEFSRLAAYGVRKIPCRHPLPQWCRLHHSSKNLS